MKVYPNDTLGDYFNNRFISVKVQMDKTKNDNEFIKNWYEIATTINKQYRIESYPTFVFLSPDGIIVHKDMGYKSVSNLIALAQTATMPGRVYDDPNAEYEKLVLDYRKGIKHYDQMPYMIQTTLKFQEEEFASQLLQDHTDYVLRLKPKKRYTKEIVTLWASYLLNSNGERFRLFYRDGMLIDKVMNKKGYAKGVVDRTIQHEIVDSFYKTQPGGSVMSSEMMLSSTGNKNKPDSSKADWNELYKTIRKKYNANYAKRNVIAAKVQWYKKHNDFTSFVDCYIEKLTLNGDKDADLNHNSWEIFLKVTDKKILNKIIPWMQDLVKQYPKWHPGLDTYANLLYKVGRKEEAIIYEEKAIGAAKEPADIAGYKKVLDQMKKGEFTYVNSGAIWE
jgi:hypothetical protein